MHFHQLSIYRQTLYLLCQQNEEQWTDDVKLHIISYIPRPAHTLKRRGKHRLEGEKIEFENIRLKKLNLDCHTEILDHDRKPKFIFVEYWFEKK